MYKGVWYRTAIGSPTEAVVRHLEELVSTRLSSKAGTPVVYSIPRKGMRWQRELVTAERLLDLADHDIDLVLDTIKVLFTEKEYAWKQRDSLLFIEREFNTAMALTKAYREREKEQKKRTDTMVNLVMAKEDIFS